MANLVERWSQRPTPVCNQNGLQMVGKRQNCVFDECEQLFGQLIGNGVQERGFEGNTRIVPTIQKGGGRRLSNQNGLNVALQTLLNEFGLWE